MEVVNETCVDIVALQDVGVGPLPLPFPRRFFYSNVGVWRAA